MVRVKKKRNWLKVPGRLLYFNAYDVTMRYIPYFGESTR